MWSSILLFGVITSTAQAHSGGIEGSPKLIGLRDLTDIKARDAIAGVHDILHKPFPQIESRQTQRPDNRCGKEFGSCGPGNCCSVSGFCGTTKDYCAAPDCQLQYGPGCDANKVPSGESTANDPRPQLGSIEYGGLGIYHCKDHGTIALTYDDGPLSFTNDLLDTLAKYEAKATFFITGNNRGKGPIDSTDSWSSVIKRMHADKHQIASHTWSHQDLSAITKEQRINQMVYNEIAIKNILGFYPTYMRPPYSSCTAESGCEGDMKALGYVVTYFDLDTDDYNNETPQEIQIAKDNFQGNLTTKKPDSGEWLVIGHDIHEQTAHNLTTFMLDNLTKAGFRAVTVGECLGDPVENWYRPKGSGGSGGRSIPSPSSSVSPSSASPSSASSGSRSSTSPNSQSSASTVNARPNSNPQFAEGGNSTKPEQVTISASTMTAPLPLLSLLSLLFSAAFVIIQM